MTEKRYTEDHEWVEIIDGNLARFGITHYAQEQLGDIVMVELPEVGKAIERGSDCAVIESVKAASDIYAPANGEVVAVNSDLEENPALVNESPEDSGWLVEFRIEDPASLDDLMGADAYREFTDE